MVDRAVPCSSELADHSSLAFFLAPAELLGFETSKVQATGPGERDSAADQDERQRSAFSADESLLHLGDCLNGRVVQIVGGHDRNAALSQKLLSKLDIGALEPNYEGDSETHALCSLDQARRYGVALRQKGVVR